MKCYTDNIIVQIPLFLFETLKSFYVSHYFDYKIDPEYLSPENPKIPINVYNCSFFALGI